MELNVYKNHQYKC